MAGQEFWGYQTRKKNGGAWSRTKGNYTTHSLAKNAGERATKGSDTYEYKVINLGGRPNDYRNKWF